MLPLVAACLPIQSQLLNRCANFVNSCLNSNNSILKLLSSLALQGSGSQMANNCNLIKSVYRIDSNGIVTGISTVFRRIARYVYFAGLDAELLEMRWPEYSEKFCGKGIELDRVIHSS